MDMQKVESAAILFNIGKIVMIYLLENQERYAEFEKWLNTSERITVDRTGVEGTIRSDMQAAYEIFGASARKAEAHLVACKMESLFGIRISGQSYVSGDEFPPPKMN